MPPGPAFESGMNDYQNAAARTSLGTIWGEGRMGQLVEPTLKLAGEAGEFADKVGKLIRDEGGAISIEAEQKLVGELGDILWYVAELSSILGYSLGDVARINIAKLRSRQERGVIHGSGDTR